MKTKLYIKYNSSSQGLNLELLGESFIGFQKLLKTFVGIAEIEGELSVMTTKISEGSIDVELTLELLSNLPFQNIQDFITFLQFVKSEAPKDVQNILNLASDGYTNVEQFMAAHPMLLMVSYEFIRHYFIKMLRISPLMKNHPVVRDPSEGDIPPKYARNLHRTINQGGYKKVLLPVIENQTESILVSEESSYENGVLINESNFEDYLAEEEEILPELTEGTEVSLLGEIKALQSTQGESLKFKAFDLPETYSLLVAYPAVGKNSEDYMPFYKQQALMTGVIKRKSLYRKPEIVITDVVLAQQSIDAPAAS